jgi:RNA polymerase sigma factor (TIGR02999 family)
MTTDRSTPPSEPSRASAEPGADADFPGPDADRAQGAEAVDALLPVVYEELRQIALAAMAREAEGHTLQPTALVNEAYLKLAGGRMPALESREHFLGIAARAMRQVLVDHARRRGADRRGGGVPPLRISLVDPGMEIPLDDLVALDQALDELEEQDPRLRTVVEYRYFAGLNDSEIAACLGVTRRTVQRDWSRARSWLNRRIYGP